MKTAMEELSPNIPLVVTPVNMSSPELDELSSITYLSYFIKVGGPGYLATLNWTQAQMRDEAINNFSVGYNTQKLIQALYRNTLRDNAALLKEIPLSNAALCHVEDYPPFLPLTS